MNNNHSIIAIQTKTKSILDSLKHPGQSYNGIISELIIEKKSHLDQENKIPATNEVTT